MTCGASTKARSLYKKGELKPLPWTFRVLRTGVIQADLRELLDLPEASVVPA